MGHLEKAIRIMGYQNCVNYKEEHERRLGTSFCSLITLKRKRPKFCKVIDILIKTIFLTTMMLWRRRLRDQSTLNILSYLKKYIKQYKPITFSSHVEDI